MADIFAAQQWHAAVPEARQDGRCSLPLGFPLPKSRITENHEKNKLWKLEHLHCAACFSGLLCSAGSIPHSAAALEHSGDSTLLGSCSAWTRLLLPHFASAWFPAAASGSPLLGVKYQSHSWLSFPQGGTGRNDWCWRRDRVRSVGPESVQHYHSWHLSWARDGTEWCNSRGLLLFPKTMLPSSDVHGTE